MEIVHLTQRDISMVMTHGEFDESLLSSAPKVAIVLTQDWCPQWGAMEKYLRQMPAQPDVKIYYSLYNQQSYFYDFMALKETRWKNALVPYVRYYCLGEFKRASNYVSSSVFLDLLGKC